MRLALGYSASFASILAKLTWAPALSLLLVASPAQAEVTHTFQSWSAAFVQARTSDTPKSFGLWFDAHVRRMSDATTVIMRPGLGWYFDSRVSVWAGYLAQPTLRDAGPNGYEHRPWQQVQLVLGPKESAWTLRTRTEQRLMHGDPALGVRLRQLVRWQYKLSEETAWVLWDEVFVGMNETPWGQPAGFDQNRFFVGPAWLPKKGVRLEAGYLSAILARPDATTLVHVLSLNAFFFR
jgi:hypothetical protein